MNRDSTRKHSTLKDQQQKPNMKLESNGNSALAKPVKQGEVHDQQTDAARGLSQQAHFLARDVICYRTGRGSISSNITARNMRRLSDELEERHALLLNNMCNNLNMTADSAHEKFVQVADEVFNDGVNWGRIVAVFTFGGKLAQFCARNGMQDNVEEIESWVGDYISGLSSWVQNQGGWESFNDHFQDPNVHEKRWWTGLVLATVGIGTVATVIYQQTCY